MRSVATRFVIAATTVAVVMLAWLNIGEDLRAQARATRADAFPQTQDRKPNLTGVWQAVNTAAWDIQDHAAQTGVPAGVGVVEGNEIPYLPSAAAKKKENYEKRATLDPETKCYLPGVPRATYMPYPFQIVQGTRFVAIGYEYAHAARRIYLDGSAHPEALAFWMGDSRGHWEGNTLVVDVRNFNGQTWFDRAGNFNSDVLHVVERYTPMTADHLLYEATIEDPKVFSRPWKMSMPLYRRMEKNPRILEYECVAYLEEETFGTAVK
jgi:hypothetical protein